MSLLEQINDDDDEADDVNGLHEEQVK